MEWQETGEAATVVVAVVKPRRVTQHTRRTRIRSTRWCRCWRKRSCRKAQQGTSAIHLSILGRVQLGECGWAHGSSRTRSRRMTSLPGTRALPHDESIQWSPRSRSSTYYQSRRTSLSYLAEARAAVGMEAVGSAMVSVAAGGVAAAKARAVLVVAQRTHRSQHSAEHRIGHSICHGAQRRAMPLHSPRDHGGRRSCCSAHPHPSSSTCQARARRWFVAPSRLTIASSPRMHCLTGQAIRP